MVFRFLAFVLFTNISVLAQTAPTLLVTADLQPSYQQGQADNLELTIVLNDPDEIVGEGVLFLNSVERDAAKKFPQAAHKIFATAAESPSIFRIPYQGAALRAGFTTTLTFRLRSTFSHSRILLANIG